jgi:membrane associated rhomboid family serine protease
MFFPIRTDRRLQHIPWVNYALIAVNVVCFLLTRNNPALRDRLMLEPNHPGLEQFVTYQFLHADWMHLLGNMLFLYVFGNSVEDRLGKVGYLAFYLAGGVGAALGHAFIETTPVIGASGAVSAVTGAYLALFPLSNVTIVFWFIFIGAFEVSSLALIVFNIAKDAVFQFTGGQNVAYLAHLAGYAFGFAVGMGLLVSRVLPRERYDMMALVERWRQRQSFGQQVRQGYNPWESAAAAAGPAVTVAAEPDRPLDARQLAIRELREGIANAARAHDWSHAAKLYAQLLDADAEQVLSQQLQLDLANVFMANHDYERAAQAYELFLRYYGSYPHREQVELILGLAYAKYLDRRERARELLKSCLPRLSDVHQKDMAQRALEQLPGVG